MMITSIIKRAEHNKSIKWLHCFTTWNYMFAILYFAFAFFKLLMYKKKKRADIDDDVFCKYDDVVSSSEDEVFLNNGEGYPFISSDDGSDFIKLSTTDKIYWFLFSTSYTTCLLVTLVFWTLLFNPKQYQEDLNLFITIDRHGVILVAVVFQYAMNMIPVRILHVVYVILIALVYFVHTYFYYISTGHLVYYIFDWHNSPRMTVGVAFALVGVIFVLQIILFLFDLLKNKICNKL